MDHSKLLRAARLLMKVMKCHEICLANMNNSEAEMAPTLCTPASARHTAITLNVQADLLHRIHWLNTDDGLEMSQSHDVYL